MADLATEIARQTPPDAPIAKELRTLSGQDEVNAERLADVADIREKKFDKTGGDVTGPLNIRNTTGHNRIEIGDPNRSGESPFVDFISSAGADRNGRIIVHGGDSTSDSGTMELRADRLYSIANPEFVRAAPTMKFENLNQGSGAAGRRWWLHANSGRFYVLEDSTGNGQWDSPHPVYWETNKDAKFGRDVHAGPGNWMYAHQFDAQGHRLTAKLNNGPDVLVRAHFGNKQILEEHIEDFTLYHRNIATNGIDGRTIGPRVINGGHVAQASLGRYEIHANMFNEAQDISSCRILWTNLGGNALGASPGNHGHSAGNSQNIDRIREEDRRRILAYRQQVLEDLERMENTPNITLPQLKAMMYNVAYLGVATFSLTSDAPDMDADERQRLRDAGEEVLPIWEYRETRRREIAGVPVNDEPHNHGLEGSFFKNQKHYGAGDPPIAIRPPGVREAPTTPFAA